MMIDANNTLSTDRNARAASTRKRHINDICIGHCAHCGEDVVADFFNDGAIRVECAHSSVCKNKRNKGDLDVETSVDFDDDDLVWLRAGWTDIDWTQQDRHTVRLESTFDIAKLPPPPFGKVW